MEKKKKIWLLIALVVCFFVAVSFVNNSKSYNFVHNYEPSILDREYFKYSEDITYDYDKIIDHSINTTLVIPIYKNENCTIKSYLKSEFYLEDGAYQNIFISDNGSDWIMSGTIGNLHQPLPTYDFVNNDRYSYFKFCDILFKIDWGTHFELLANISTCLFNQINGEYENGEYEIEKNTYLSYSTGAQMIRYITWNNFLSYKNGLNWYLVSQINDVIWGALTRDYLKFDVNLAYYVRSFSQGGSGGNGGGSW